MKDDEEELLRAVASQNAESIRLARQRAEAELVEAKETLEQRTHDLAHSVAMMRATLDSTPSALLVTDNRGRVTSFNEKLVAMWGLPPEVMSPGEHRTLLENMSGLFDDPRQFLARIEAIEASSETESSDLLELADGRLIERVSRIQLVAGRNAGRVWSFRDVTEQRRADEARARLAAVVDSSDDAIVSKNLNGIIRSWNDGARRVFGYAADEVIGKSITVLLPADRVQEEESILQRLQRGERVEHFEAVRVHKDGRLIDVSVTISPIRDASGRVIGASKIARDITDRKRVERRTQFLADASAALAVMTRSEVTLAKIAELAVPRFADWCAVDLRDAGGAVRRVAIVHADPALVQRASELSHRYRPRATEPFGVMKVLRTGEPDWVADIPDALLVQTAQGDEHLRRLRDLHLRSYMCVPLKSRSEPIGALTFAMSESRRVYGADDVRAASDLAQRAVIAIENANLVAALRESDRLKDEFLAVLAHELRNPLAPIRNAVQILCTKGPPVPELQWAREVIVRQVDQMSRLVDDLLDVSRIRQGKIELRKERIELAAVINDAVETALPLIKKCGHEFTVELPQEPVILDADRSRLAQVVLNLLNNAAKYTNDGGHLWLSAECIDDEVAVRIRDTGIGIPGEMLPGIFEMFQQGDRSPERSQGGLGIGLTLVQRLVAMHGGTVEAHSPGPGKGSEFIVRLPLAGNEVSSGAPRALANERATDATACRILVVDDNHDTADSLATLLRMTGHEVRTAYDGSAAVATAETFRPNVVLLDIGLPHVSGYDVARQIKGDRGRDVLLIALTGWGQEEDRRRSREAGCDHHLTKPVDFGELSRLLAQAVTGRRDRAAAATR